jgi:hypothetical protein
MALHIQQRIQDDSNIVIEGYVSDTEYCGPASIDHDSVATITIIDHDGNNHYNDYNHYNDKDFKLNYPSDITINIINHETSVIYVGSTKVAEFVGKKCQSYNDLLTYHDSNFYLGDNKLFYLDGYTLTYPGSDMVCYRSAISSFAF